jgi:quercetin dioxygenase-like cupin family protein
MDARGVAFTELWRLASVPADLSGWGDREPAKQISISPDGGGVNFRIVQFDPQTREHRLRGREAFEFMGSPEAHVPGARHPNMHRTSTVDFAIVLSGEITMLLDADAVQLSAGDVVIQRGTNHAWANERDAPCLIAFVLIDAR